MSDERSESDFEPGQEGQRGEGEAETDAEERARTRFGRKIGEGILSGLLEGGAAIRRGQDKVSGVAQGTKEEILRIVGSEVRGFLDKIDVVDIMQQVVSGLVIDVNAQIRIRRDDDGKLSSDIAKQDLRISSASKGGTKAAPGSKDRPSDESDASD